MDSKKSNKITEIVRLQRILKKWRKLANSSKASSSSSSNVNGSGSGKSIKFLKRTLSLSDRSTSVRDDSGSGDVNVPKGYLAVSVGEELKRFVIPTQHLGHRAFEILLREAEEEFGFQQEGVLRFPCDVPVFESVLKMVEQKKDISFILQKCSFSADDLVGYCPSDQTQLPAHNSHHNPHSPMCR